MRLIVKLSAMMALLCSLVMLLMLSSSALSFFYLNQHRTDRQMAALSLSLDQALSTEPLSALDHWLPYALESTGIGELEIRQGSKVLYRFPLRAQPGGLPYGYRDRRLALAHRPDLLVTASYRVAPLSEGRTLGVTAPVSVAIVLAVLSLLAGFNWLRRQIEPQESLEYRAKRIIHGERESVRESAGEPTSLTGSAIDRLLSDLAQAREQRSRVDILIRAFAARDAKTGLSNRLFFDSQLALQLEENQEVGAHGVVMLLRSADADIMENRAGAPQVNGLLHSLINLVSTFVMRYPNALLARYFHGDLAVLLPHCSVKEAESLAGQLIGGLDTLAGLPVRRRDDLLNIGICRYRKGQTAVEIMEAAERATREAVLQGAIPGRFTIAVCASRCAAMLSGVRYWSERYRRAARNYWPEARLPVRADSIIWS
ncbi:diguanylate cyclase [Acerihabitans sp. KWT182]|uniref:Diguanylate cyclase n=1 Tax=Acerihabitans sp. KWT182 TaxID=3157919 RepID=A0AAU7Q8J9_9GAMM